MNKNIFKLSVLLMTAVIFGITSCSDDDNKEPSVVGFWELVKGNNVSSDDVIYWEIKESGELIQYLYNEGFFVDEHHSTFDYNGKAFVMHEDDEDATYSVISLTFNDLVLAAYSDKYEFKRIDGLPSPKSITSADFVGHKFIGEDSYGKYEFTFLTDSRLRLKIPTINQYIDGTYRLDSDKITFYIDNSSEAFVLQILTHKRLSLDGIDLVRE